MKILTSTAALSGMAALTWLALGCHKEEPGPYTPAPVPPSGQPMQQLFADNLAAATQHFTINTDGGPAYLTGAKGLLVRFQQHAFRKADGSIASGNIDVALVEAYTAGDMLLLNKQTLGMDNGQPKLLVSGGQFYIAASQGAEDLSLAGPNMALFSVPGQTSAPDPNMSLFGGAVQSDGTMLWSPWQSDPVITLGDSTLMDSVGTASWYYTFTSDSLAWINCDYFYGSGLPLTAVQATTPEGFDHTNTCIWLVFPDLNAVTNLYGQGNAFGTMGGYEVPVGQALTVVALALVDGAYYASFTNTVASAGMNVAITLQPTTLEEFELTVDGL